MDNNALFKILGFAYRAQKISIGMTSTVGALKRKQIRLIILAEDLSANAGRKIELLVAETVIPVYRVGSKADWGQLFNRTDVGILGISDTNFAKSIKKILDDG
jgi:ribosomal protein L7Ae-like RNA K-turn-binding protein